MKWYCISIKLDDDTPIGLPLASCETAEEAVERLKQIKALCNGPVEFIIEEETDVPDVDELLYPGGR